MAKRRLRRARNRPAPPPERAVASASLPDLPEYSGPHGLDTLKWMSREHETRTSSSAPRWARWLRAEYESWFGAPPPKGMHPALVKARMISYLQYDSFIRKGDLDGHERFLANFRAAWGDRAARNDVTDFVGSAREALALLVLEDYGKESDMATKKKKVAKKKAVVKKEFGSGCAADTFPTYSKAHPESKLLPHGSRFKEGTKNQRAFDVVKRMSGKSVQDVVSALDSEGLNGRKFYRVVLANHPDIFTIKDGRVLVKLNNGSKTCAQKGNTNRGVADTQKEKKVKHTAKPNSKS